MRGLRDSRVERGVLKIDSERRSLEGATDNIREYDLVTTKISHAYLHETETSSQLG